MPHFLFLRHEDGSTELKEVTIPSPEPLVTPDVDAMDSIDSEATLTFHRCAVCGKDFSIPALLAKHFHRDHADLDKSKTEWKQYWNKVAM